MKVYILRLDFSEGSIDIYFQTESSIPFLVNDFYYPSVTLSERQIQALDRICGRDFLKTYYNLDRFSISEKRIHSVIL